jgi:hypothetical protein
MIQNKHVLDLDIITKKAKQYDMSPYALIKRELNFREKAKGDDCFANCKMRCSPIFHENERVQCYWIGVSENKNADVTMQSLCDWHERICERKMEDLWVKLQT